jgi:hypothetical protein
VPRLLSKYHRSDHPGAADPFLRTRNIRHFSMMTPDTGVVEVVR